MTTSKIISLYEKLSRFLPFLSWLPELKNWCNLRSDLLAGLTVAMVVIPQSMAYAHLAGLPVYMGLYASCIPTIIAALFCSSRYLATGPVPVASLLTAVALQPLAAIGTSEYLSYVVLLTLMAGLIQVGLSLLRFGVVMHFVSYPVILGFVNAVAVIIACMQLNHIFGVYADTHSPFFLMLWQVISDAATSLHWPTVMIALVAATIILGGKKLLPKFPHVLIAVVLTTLFAWLSGYEKLQTVNVSDVMNYSVQQMMGQYEDYPNALQRALKKVKQTKQEVSHAIKSTGQMSDKTNQAMSQALLAKLSIAHLIDKHSLETRTLSRLRFKKLVTPKNNELFFVSDQAIPKGQQDSHEWRIEKLPENGKITLQSGGEVVGEIPSGLPHFKMVTFRFDIIADLFIAAVVIAFLGFTESITIAKSIATEKRQQLNTNQELFSQGLAKCIGSFFQSMPISAGFSRTAVNRNSGAKTPFSSIFSGIIVMLVLIWFTSLFYYLPYATLAVIIMTGVLGLLNIKEMRRVWKINRREGIVSLITFILTLALAPKVAYGIVFGAIVALGLFLFETMRPKLAELIRDKDGKIVERIAPPKESLCELISMVRFHGALYFVNAAFFESKILQLVNKKQKLHYIVLDCISLSHIDASGLETLLNVNTHLNEAGVALYLTRVKKTIMATFERGGFVDALGSHQFFHDNEQALLYIKSKLSPNHLTNCALYSLSYKNSHR